MIEYNEKNYRDSENYTTLSSQEFKENVFDSHLDVNVNKSSSTEKLNTSKRLPQIIEKSSMVDIMDNQSKIEEEMIKIFNREINAFPYYRLHTLSVETSRIHSDHKIMNPTIKFVL